MDLLNNAKRNSVSIISRLLNVWNQIKVSAEYNSTLIPGVVGIGVIVVVCADSDDKKSTTNITANQMEALLKMKENSS